MRKPPVPGIFPGRGSFLASTWSDSVCPGAVHDAQRHFPGDGGGQRLRVLRGAPSAGSDLAVVKTVKRDPSLVGLGEFTTHFRHPILLGIGMFTGVTGFRSMAI